jgi:type II secretion system protein N
MVSVKSIFAYVVYTLLAIALFLYLLFPDQVVEAYLQARLAAVDPSLSMTTEEIQPAIPPGLKMIGIDLDRDSERLVHIDEARISPAMTSLLQARKRVRFDARLADGTVNGQAIVDNSTPSGQLHVEADLSQIQLDKLDVIEADKRFTLAGSLTGRLSHDSGSAPIGMTNGTLTATGLRINLKSPFFGIADLMMNQTDAEFSMSGPHLRLKALTFDGPMLEGKISGTIELRNPLAQSRLNLAGNAKPQPELFAQLQGRIPQGIIDPRTLGTRGLVFRIRGTIDSPSVSLR